MSTRANHLTPDELEALARGEQTAPSVREHVGICAACREAAREGVFATRYVRPLADDHPDEDVLTALWSRALSSARAKEVEQHVATCSRCRALLERVVRATPVESYPAHVGDRHSRRTEDWAAASMSPRFATLVVRASERWGPLQASFLPRPGFMRHLAARFKARPSSEAPELGEGKLAFRFRPYREGVATYLAVACVHSRPSAIAVTLVPEGGPPQHAEIRAGSEAIVELTRGTSRLVIDTSPPWELEVRVDA